MFERLFAGTSVPVLAEVMAFAAARQRVLANNVANIDTPGFRALDLPEARFREALAAAVERARRGGVPLGLEPALYQPVRIGGTARVDGNDVSLDSELAKMSKNATEYQVAARLLAGRLRFLRDVIRERMR